MKERDGMRRDVILNACPDAVIAFDLRGVVTEWNRQAESLLGRRRDKVVGRELHRLVFPESHWDVFHHGLSEFSRTGQWQMVDATTELEVLDHDRQLIRVDWRLRVLEAGKGLECCAFVRPSQGSAGPRVDRLAETVDLVRRAEEAEDQLSLALNSSKAGSWNWNMRTGVIVWDDYIHPLFGLAPGTFGGRYDDFESLLHPEHRLRVTDAVQRCIHHNTSLDIEFQVVWPDGSEHAIASRGKVYRNLNGEPIRMTGICWDVTQRNRNEFDLHAANERLSGVLNAATEVSIISTDKEGIIRTFNSGAERMLGYTADEVVDKLTPKIIHDEQEVVARSRTLSEELGRPVEGFDVFVAYAKRGKTDRRDWTYIRKDGSRFKVNLVVTPIKNDAGETTGFLGIAEDVTKQLEAMEAMRQAKEDAEAANRAKSSFLANMSHEIRTPMNGILGMTQLVSQTSLDNQQQNYVRTIHDSAEVLLRLLNDILDFSKIEAGKLELVCEPFHIGKVVARAARMFSLKAREKAIEIVVRIQPDIPVSVVGDPDRLQQVLVNLIGNAIKFTHYGEVYVDVGIESQGPDHIQLSFTVVDSGIGIEPRKLQQIFQPFTQAESTTTRRFGGTGLGLAISKQIVEMMHGQISATSQLGKGATFRFTARFESHAEPEPDREALVGRRALVIDSNQTRQQLLDELLSHWKMKATIANTAAGARAVLAQPDTDPVDVILLDSGLPQGDAVQYITELAANQHTSQTPIIFMSTGAETMDGELVRETEQCRLLSRPAAPQELWQMLAELLVDGEAREPRPHSAPSIATQQLHVLLVEDNEVNRRVAIGLLNRRGHTVSVAVNGREAVELVGAGDFDVVLMDLQMPVMDGVEATQAIRQAESGGGNRVPIIAMTADALEGVREQCLDAGMDDYITKPVSPAAMYEAVERLGNATAQSGREAEPANPANAGDPNKSQTSNAGQASNAGQKLGAQVHSAQELAQEHSAPGGPQAAHLTIDWTAVRSRLPGDDQVLHEFIALANRDTRRLFQELLAAVDTGDATGMQRAAHTIKSTARHFGFAPVATAAIALEEAGRAGAIRDVQPLVAALETQLEHFYQALDAKLDQ